MDVHSRQERVSPILPSTPNLEEELAETAFTRRLGHAIMMLAIAIPAHVWLVRTPDPHPAMMAGSSTPAPALSQAPRAAQPSPAVPRSAFDPLLASTTRSARPRVADAPATLTTGRPPSSDSSDSSGATGRGGGNRLALHDAQPETNVHVAPVATSGRSIATVEPAADRTGAGASGRAAPRTDQAERPVQPVPVHRVDSVDSPAAPWMRDAGLPVTAPATAVAELVGGIAGPWTAREWNERPDRAAPAPTAGARPRSPERAPIRAVRAADAPEDLENRAGDEALSGGASDLRRQEAIVLQVLERYARAFERLDVQAAKAVWPTLDARALRRAFHQLDAQQLRFTTCGVSIAGQAANARCLGDATYHPKVGGRPLHLPAREWTFSLFRHEDGWQIVNATLQ